MKRSFPFCLSLLMCIIAATSTGQVKLQYWIDLDPSGLKEINISGLSATSAIDVSNLSDGLHFLTYRAYAAGLWSAPRTSIFLTHKPEATATRAVELEYWIDGNYTETKNLSLTNNSGTAVLDLSGMSNGIHTLSYRAKDDNGTWSAPITSLILNTASAEPATAITTAQYWFDDDIGHLASETLPSPTSPYNYNRQIAADTVKARTTGGNIRVMENEEGATGFYDLHYIHTRFSDDKGRWTTQRTDSFGVAFGNERLDASFLIVNPKAANGLTGWKRTGQTIKSTGEHYSDSSQPYFSLGNRNADSWSASISQTIPNLPAGTYLLSVTARGHSDVIATLTANKQSTSIATTGAEGGEIWNLSPEGSEQRNVNDGKGFGWNETVLMVTTDGSPLEMTVEGNSPTAGGFLDVVDFRLTKVASTTLNVGFAPSVDMSPLKGTKLRLTGNAATSTVTVSSKRSYEFAGLSDSEPYTITLLNQFDQVLWQREEFTIASNGNDITISDIRASRSLSLTVLDDSGRDVSQKVKAEWLDAKSQVLASGLTAADMADGNRAGYRISLGDSLGTIYHEPPVQFFEISESTAQQTCRLAELPKATLSGSVTANGFPLWKARVNTSQLINGKYRYTSESSIDNDGKFSLTLPDDSLTVLVSASGVYNHTLNLPRPADIGNVDMKSIQSRSIRLSITTIDLHSEDETAEVKTSVSGYDNLQFKAVNRSQGDTEIPVIVQNGCLYIEDATHGDRLELTATDRTGNYIEANCPLTYDADSSMVAEFSLKAHGAVKVGINGSDNPLTEYILFDADGNFVRSATANNGQSATIFPLTSGEYTVVAIGGSSLTSMFSNLNALNNAGLNEGHDYVKATAAVTDAIISEVQLPFLPRLDETRFYYTTDLTSFIVNETQPIPGSYITFTTRIDLKDEYKEMADGLQFCVDIPDGMEYIHNSAIVGCEPVLADIEGNRLIIPLTRENHIERIRFCFVPTQPGTSYTTASLRINADKQIDHPIGRIAIDTRDFEINAPNMTARPAITINGTAVAGSTIVIYDNDIAIGTTEAKKDGRWQVRCSLDEGYHLSRHPVYAKITTPDGHDLVTPTRTVTFDIEANRVKTVTMINTAHRTTLTPSEFRTVFDFDNPKEKCESYSYWPKYPDFTFIVDFADNNPEYIDNVQVCVKTTSGTDRVLKAAYDSISNKWLATGKFTSKILPINVSVKYENYKNYNLIDSKQISSDFENFIKSIIDRENEYNNLERLEDILTEIANSNEIIDSDIIDQIYKDLGFEELLVTEEDLDADPEIRRFIYDLLDNANDSEIDDAIKNLITQIDSRIDYSEFIFSSFEPTENINGVPFIIGNEEWTIDTFGSDNPPFDIKDGFVYIDNTESKLIYYKQDESEQCILNISDGYYVIIRVMDTDVPKRTSTLTPYGIISLVYMFKTLKDDVFIAFDKTIHAIDEYLYEVILFGKEIAQSVSEYSENVIKLTQTLDKLIKLYDNAKFGLKKTCSRSIKLKKAISKIRVRTRQLKNITSFLDHAFSVEKAIHHANDIYENSVLKIEGYLDKCKIHRASADNLIKDIIECKGESDATKYISIIENQYDYFSGLCYSNAMIVAAYSVPDILSLGYEVYELFLGFKKLFKSVVLNEEAIQFLKSIDDEFKFTTRIKNDMTRSKNSHISKDDHIIDELFKDNYKTMRKQFLTDCEKGEDEDDGQPEDESNPKEGEDSNNPNAKPLIDPSGYVYEAVTSNRLEGVEATIYEQGAATPWDAENYHQENPQTTDESGRYAWDVPVGNWQVRFNKRGYEPKATEWLPVPPPQLDINIPMVHAVNPSVKKAAGVPSGITVTFDKYMEPTLLTAERISASGEGGTIKGRIELVDLEEDPNTGKSYASKAKFAPDEPLHVGEVVQLHVDKTVESYAKMPMLDDCTLDVTIQSEITSLISESQLTVAPGSSQAFDIYAEPAEAAAGQSVTIHAASSLYSVSDSIVKFDAYGHALVSVAGKIPGSAPIVMTIDDTELETETHINVAYAETSVRSPKSSIPTGSTVEPGSVVILYTETEETDIYYTTDGSCPCDESTRTLYTAPITIDRDMTLKAVAEKDGLESSSIATFNYTISTASAINPATDSDGHVIISDKAITLVDLSGHDCRIYDLSGNTVWTGSNLNGNKTIPLARNEIYFVVISLKGHVAVTKVFIH